MAALSIAGRHIMRGLRRRSAAFAAGCLFAAGIPAGQAPADGAPEAQLRSLIGTTSQAFAGLDDALGLKDQPGVAAANAACATRGTCSVGNALDDLKAIAGAVHDEIQQHRSDETRLGDAFTQPAVALLLQVLQALPAWTALAHSSPLLHADPALAQKWAGTRQACLGALRAAVDYVKFSGGATQQAEALLGSGAAAP